MAKALLLLRSAAPETLENTLAQRLPRLCDSDVPVLAQLLRAVRPDPFYDPSAGHARPDVVVELKVAAGRPLADFQGALTALLEDTPYERDSLALAMHERELIPCEPQRFIYHYLMLRKPGFSRADYLDYYARFHSRMGAHTPAIAGYAQNDVDPDASAAIADRLGLACREVTSISELRIPDVEAFMAHPELARVGGPAAEDEARFVDRAASVSFCCERVLCEGEAQAARGPAFPQHFPLEPQSVS